VLPIFMGVTAVATLSFSLITTAFGLTVISNLLHEAPKVFAQQNQ
jgi:hypothetical protein